MSKVIIVGQNWRSSWGYRGTHVSILHAWLLWVQLRQQQDCVRSATPSMSYLRFLDAVWLCKSVMALIGALVSTCHVSRVNVRHVCMDKLGPLFVTRSIDVLFEFDEIWIRVDLLSNQVKYNVKFFKMWLVKLLTSLSHAHTIWTRPLF